MKEQMLKLNEISCEIDRAAGGLGDLQNLAESIKEFGLINAIIVIPLPADERFKYKVIAGRRRYKAAELLGLQEIRCNVIEESSDADYIGLVENTNRLEMHPLDEGELFKKLINRGESIEDLTSVYARSKSGIYQRIKLTELIPEAKEQYKAGRFTLTQAAQLAVLTEDKQEAVLKAVEKIKDDSGSDGFKFEFSRTLSAKANHSIGRYFDASVCESCPTRTNYGDPSLFPELAGTNDFCLKPACYQKQLEKEASRRLTEAIEEKMKDEQDAPAVVVIDDKGLFEDKNFTYVDASGKRQDEFSVLKPKDIYILDEYYYGYAGNLKTDELPEGEDQLVKWAFTPFNYAGKWELFKCLLKADHKEKPKEKQIDRQELQRQEDVKGMSIEEKEAYKKEFAYSTYQADKYAHYITCCTLIQTMTDNMHNIADNFAAVVMNIYEIESIQRCIDLFEYDLQLGDDEDAAYEKLRNWTSDCDVEKMLLLLFTLTANHELQRMDLKGGFFERILSLNKLDREEIEQKYNQHRAQYIREKIAESLKANPEETAETEKPNEGEDVEEESPENRKEMEGDGNVGENGEFQGDGWEQEE